MTHDELLAKLENYGYGGQLPLVALRAVVELHKPDNSIPPYSLKYCTCEEMYPCSTIQAIEKELKNGSI